jgi:hypothetical protein
MLRSKLLLPLIFMFAPLLFCQVNPAKEACALQAVCKAKITLDEGYVTGTELVEANRTVQEIVRGAKAWALVSNASHSHKPAEPGMEYIAARKDVSMPRSWRVQYIIAPRHLPR